MIHYPKSDRRTDALADLGFALDHQGQTRRAIQRYTEWLRDYPKGPQKKKISLRLARLYRRANNFGQEAGIYLQWIQGNPADSLELQLPLADTYYRLKNYQKAAHFYQAALKGKETSAETDWMQFQLAKCYNALGQREQGKKMLDQLAQSTKDPLMKQLAAATGQSLTSRGSRGVSDGIGRKKG